MNPLNFNLNQIRTRITCSADGREKSVKTAMERHFRIDSKIWIRAQPGDFRISLKKSNFILPKNNLGKTIC